MSASEKEMRAFLDNFQKPDESSMDLSGGDSFDEDAARQFLEGKTGIDSPAPAEQGQDRALPSEFQIPGGFKPDMQEAMLEKYGQSTDELAAQKEQQMQDAQFRRQAEQRELSRRDIGTQASDFPAAINAEVLSLLGIPGNMWNATAKMLGAEKAMGPAGLTSKDMVQFGADIGATYAPDQTPDTALTKAGTFLAQGVEFLLPVLRWGRAAGTPAASTRGLTKITPGGKVVKNVSTGKLVAEKIAAPFKQSPGMAWTGESVASTAAGIGAYYGKEKYGPTGEMAAALAGGAAAQPFLMGGRELGKFAKRQIFTMSEAGSKQKLRDYTASISGTTDIPEKITKAQSLVLSKAKIPAAKLSGDHHLIRLTNDVLDDNPALQHEFRMMEDETNMLARQEMDKLGGKVPIEETQAFLRGRVQKIEFLLNARVKLAAENSKETVAAMSPKQQLKSVNDNVKDQLDAALVDAKKIEQEAWNKVDKDVYVSTEELLSTHQQALEKQQATQAGATIKMPKFVNDFLGKFENGQYVPGTYGSRESVLELKEFRTLLYDEIKKPDTTTNLKRLLTDLRNSAFKDMELAKDKTVQEAIEVSRVRHDTFEGDIMEKVFGRNKQGREIDSGLTLESVKSGPKSGPQAAVSIKKILKASPGSFDEMEQLIKIQIANSNILKVDKDGFKRINVVAAKKYMNTHEQVLDIFPALRKQLDTAIGREERFIATKGSIDARIKKIESGTAYKISKDGVAPGRVLPDIMKSPYPAKEMKKAISQSNKTGRRGLRNDAVNFLMKSAETERVDEQGNAFLSGQKLAKVWKENKKVLSQTFNKYELKRFERILLTIQKNETPSKLPEIGKILPPTNILTAVAMRAVGLSIGHKLGQVTGSPLHATSKVMGVTEKFVDLLDSGRAKRMLVDAIQNPDLFKVITANPVNLTRHDEKLLRAWTLTVTLDALNDE